MKSPKTAAVASKSGVQLSVFIRRSLDDGQLTVSYFPLHILLARPVPDGETQQPYCYGFKQACQLTGAHKVGSPQARFVLPDIYKLPMEFKSGCLAVLLAHFDDIINQTEIDLIEDHIANEGYCLMVKVPIDLRPQRQHDQRLAYGQSSSRGSNHLHGISSSSQSNNISLTLTLEMVNQRQRVNDI